MSQRDSELDRLLRAAAAAPDDAAPAEAPFGFDTRVLAAWRSYRSRENGDFRVVAHLFKRIALTATVVAAVASAGAFWQLRQNNDLDDATGGGYAMADTVIEAGALQ